MKVITVLVMYLAVVFFTNGCLVTKKAHNELLNKNKGLDIEIQKLKKELSDANKKMAEQENRITTLMHENMVLQSKYEYDMKVAKKRQEEFRGKYEMCRQARNEKIDALQTRQRGGSLTSDQKKTTEGLYRQLQEQLQEEIKKGKIKIELHRK